jgi:uncharacterized protein (TIGR03435 family)
MMMRHSRVRPGWFIVPAVLVAASTLLSGQSSQPSTELRFDVASVKPALTPFEAGRAGAPFTFGLRILPGGRISGSLTLKQIITRSYGVADYAVAGGPSWLTTDYFAIEASAGREATAAEINAMLQTLLRDRFALRTHSENREAPAFVLSLARSDGRLGAGVKRTSDECIAAIEARKNATAPPPPSPQSSGPREPPTTPTCGVVTMVSRSSGATTMLWGGQDVKSLISRISTELAAPVIDRTGLEGLFDITLEYTPARQSATGLDPNSNDLPPPPIATALQQQLGLKLEKQNAPLQVIVIDSVERPQPD